MSQIKYNKFIIIKLPQEYYVEEIRLYNGIINDNYVKKIIINIDGYIKKANLNKKLVNVFKIKRNCKLIKIKIDDKKCFNGFSEIELISNKENMEYVDDNKLYKSCKFINFIDKIIINFFIFVQKVYRKLFIKKIGY